MSVRVTSLVWDSDVQAPERFTLLALADRADETGKCWPSVKWLARKCQTSGRTVRRHLSWLEEEGLVRRSGRRNDSNMYFVQLSELRRRKQEDDDDPDDPCQIDTPDNLTPPDTVSPLSESHPLTQVAATPCQIDTQYVIDPSLLSSPTAPRPGNTKSGSKTKVEPVREDVEGLCRHLRDRIVGNGSKPPSSAQVNGWRKAARLLIDRDIRDIAEAHRLIDWCQDDDFWRSNIGGMPKFRQQYDALRLRAQAAGGRHLASVAAPPALPADPAAAFADLRSRAAAVEAARLLGIPCRIEAQPPSDETDPQVWVRQQYIAWLDAHQQQICAVFTERKTG